MSIYDVIRKILRMTAKVNQPTPKKMTSELNIYNGTVHDIISEILEAKLKIKCIEHQLNMAQIKKNGSKSWRLYR